MARNATNSVKYAFAGKEAFCLRRAITLKASRQGGFFVYSYNPLGITAYGRTKVESLRAFVMELSSAWHRIALAQDDILAPDALELKQKLIKLVKSVRPIREVLSELNQDA